MTNETLSLILEAIRQETLSPCIKLTPYRHATKLWDSKLGGDPYLPSDMPYPTTPSGEPLKLLAQLNFSQFPPLKGFPTEGILQFYILPDDVYGMNFEQPTLATTFRVLYHPHILTDLNNLQTPPTIDYMEDFPFEGCFALEASLTYRMLSPEDHRFNKCFMRHARHLLPNLEETTSFLDLLTSEQLSLIDTYFESTGHHISGYPYFTQDDPREDAYNDYSVLLFQLDSCGNGKNEIIWGDCGVGHFFITPSDLAKRDFSHVLYTWDCC